MFQLKPPKNQKIGDRKFSKNLRTGLGSSWAGLWGFCWVMGGSRGRFWGVLGGSWEGLAKGGRDPILLLMLPAPTEAASTSQQILFLSRKCHPYSNRYISMCAVSQRARGKGSKPFLGLKKLRHHPVLYFSLLLSDFL